MKWIKNLVFPQEFPVIVAVSGGVDSMVLLAMMMQYTSRENIIVAHFHHSLRSVDADMDAALVRDFCREHWLACITEQKPIAELAHREKASIEATARRHRYEFFARLYAEHCAQCLLTAHHLDDRIETAMFNMIRGSKMAGISALKQETTLSFSGISLRVMRPLLSLSKGEILEWAHAHQVPFREDVTNADTTIPRNFLRHEILPKFANINSEYRRALGNFIDYVEELAALESHRVIQWLEAEWHREAAYCARVSTDWLEYIFDIRNFAELPRVMQCSVLEHLYSLSNQWNLGLSRGLIDELLRFILVGENSFGKKHIKQLRLERRGNRILFFL